MTEARFSEILNDLSEVFISELQNVAGQEIAAQVGRVIVPVQKIGGIPEHFSVMAFPFPRLTPEQLRDMPLVEEVSHILSIGNAEFKVDLDHFGQVNWIHVKGAPNIYEALKIALSRAVEKGGYIEFWKH